MWQRPAIQGNSWGTSRVSWKTRVHRESHNDNSWTFKTSRPARISVTDTSRPVLPLHPSWSYLTVLAVFHFISRICVGRYGWLRLFDSWSGEHRQRGSGTCARGPGKRLWWPEVDVPFNTLLTIVTVPYIHRRYRGRDGILIIFVSDLSRRRTYINLLWFQHPPGWDAAVSWGFEGCMARSPTLAS